MATRVKFTTVGNSASIALLKESLSHLPLQKGETLHVISIRPSIPLVSYHAKLAAKMQVGEPVIRRPSDALRKLAA